MAKTSADIQKTIHSNPESLQLQKIPNADVSFSVFGCATCNIQFRPLSALVFHNEKYHNIQETSLQQNGSIDMHDLPFRQEVEVIFPEVERIANDNFCLNCGFVYTSTLSELNHACVYKLERRFICRVCNTSFSSLKYLDEHNVWLHDGQIPGMKQSEDFSCPKCGLNLPSYKYLTIHIKMKHGLIYTKGEMPKVFKLFYAIA